MKNLQKGFTLIELMIYTALFAIVLGISVDFFFLSKTIATEVTQYQEVDRNARVVFLDMSQTIRGATSVTTPTLGQSASELVLNGGAITYATGSAGVLQKTEGGNTSDLTADSVEISNVMFTTRGEAGDKATVSISFTMQTKTRVYGKPDYITKDFQTTVQLR